ncbi:MAG: hypothetical protein EPO06_11565 [Burkholderiaceae bacterium]|nr:MAG: hypothetical protein EPO06_11565 [Burkholderiaceae bacterium]
MYAYRNENTGDVRRFAAPHPRLEALRNWERIDDDSDHVDTRAADSAAAERASIEAAAAARAQDAADKAAATAERAAAEATSQHGDTPPGVTLTHYEPANPRTVDVPLVSETSPASPDGVLSRDGGPAGPTQDELLDRQAADSAKLHGGVLSRTSGDKPTDTRALRAQAMHDMENPSPDGVLSRGTTAAPAVDLDNGGDLPAGAATADNAAGEAEPVTTAEQLPEVDPADGDEAGEQLPEVDPASDEADTDPAPRKRAPAKKTTAKKTTAE